MPYRNIPFWNRPDVVPGFSGVRQVMNTCVFAANAGAVNFLSQRQVWTLGSLIDAAVSAGEWEGGPAIGCIAHDPVKTGIDYVFNTKSQTLLTSGTVRQWVEDEGRVIILSRPYRHNPRAFHMLTLFAWNADHYIAWDTVGKMGIIYDHEIEQGIPYQNGSILDQHPNHDAFVYWKR